MKLHRPERDAYGLEAPTHEQGFSGLDKALAFLRKGGVVALPTDTLYGLAADVTNKGALKRVFDIKGRPAELALPVLVANWDQVGVVANVECSAVARLASMFWPGSLTFVLPKQPDLSPLVTGGRETVAVRMPDHWVPLSLASQLERPITGTSANRSGQPDLKTLAEVRNVLGESVSAVIASGPVPLGLQSTIVDLTGSFPVLLRQGATPFAQVSQAWEDLAGREPEAKSTGVQHFSS